MSSCYKNNWLIDFLQYIILLFINITYYIRNKIVRLIFLKSIKNNGSIVYIVSIHIIV